MECCGTHQKHRWSPSTRSPDNHQLLSASTFRFRTSDSGTPRCQKRHKAYDPSALDETIAIATPAATGQPRGTTVHANKKMALMNRSAVPTALTFKNVSI